jgi:hypothetical protein
VKPSLRALSPVLLGLLLGACQTPNEVADLAKNDLFYVDVPFQTKAPGDRPVFVAPMADGRGNPVLPTHERGFPIAYGGDDFWERPVSEMVGEVLQRQLEASLLFPTVATTAEPQGLIIKPTLTSFLGGSTAAMSGARTFAEVGVRVQILGPTAADGQRPVLLEQTFGNRQMSPLELNPASPYRLYGRALQLTMSKLLTALDGSNVARSNVPMDLPAAAEASARAR